MWVLRLSQTTRLGAGISDGGANFARSDIERGDQGFRAMPDILELPPFDVPPGTIML
jgi:hypothetical protein